VAAVLYYTSIAAGLVRLDQRISQLNDAELRRGFTWAKDQRWVDPPIQQLLAQGLQKLSPPGPASAATP